MVKEGWKELSYVTEHTIHLLLTKDMRKESEAALVEEKGENERKHSTWNRKRKNSLMEELEDDKNQ